MRNHSRRKACWKHTSKVCPSNPQKQMSFRGGTVPPIIARLFLLRAISGESFLHRLFDHIQGCSTIACSACQPHGLQSVHHQSISLSHHSYLQVPHNPTGGEGGRGDQAPSKHCVPILHTPLLQLDETHPLPLNRLSRGGIMAHF